MCSPPVQVYLPCQITCEKYLYDGYLKKNQKNNSVLRNIWSGFYVETTVDFSANISNWKTNWFLYSFLNNKEKYSIRHYSNYFLLKMQCSGGFIGGGVKHKKRPSTHSKLFSFHTLFVELIKFQWIKFFRGKNHQKRSLQLLLSELVPSPSRKA